MYSLPISIYTYLYIYQYTFTYTLYILIYIHSPTCLHTYIYIYTHTWLPELCQGTFNYLYHTIPCTGTRPVYTYIPPIPTSNPTCAPILHAAICFHKPAEQISGTHTHTYIEIYNHIQYGMLMQIYLESFT